MIISVPLNTPLDEDAQTTLASTDVEDTTDIWVNTSSEDIPIDQEYQENDKIYQNTTLDVIPVVPYEASPAEDYEIGDLVFTSDGETPAVDRVHEITGTTGDYPKQPEDYTVIPSDTSYDETTWDARYMKMGDIPLGASLHGRIYTFSGNEVTAFRVSHDGTMVWVGGLSTSNNATIYECPLAIPFDISSVTGQKAVTTLSGFRITDIDVDASGHQFLFTIENQPPYTDRITYSYTLTNPNTFSGGNTASSNLHWNVIYEDEIKAVKFDSTGDNLYVNTNNLIVRYALSSTWDVSTVNQSAWSEISISLPETVFDFTWSDSGTKVWVSYKTPSYMREYTMTTAYDISAMVYSGTQIALEGLDGYHNQVSDNGTKLYQLVDESVNQPVYQFDLLTANDITTKHYSIFPFYHTETRNSIVYAYQIKYDSNTDTWYMQTTRNGVFDANWVMTAFDHVSDTLLEEKAYIGTNGVWLAKTLILRDGEGFYIRTNTDAEVETESLVSYRYQVVNSVADIKGIAQLGYTIKYNPFDSTNYTLATKYGSMYYTLQGTEKFDTIALGHVKADHILVEFKDATGAVVTTIDRDIDSSRDVLGNLPDWKTTLVYYCDEVLEAVNGVYPSVKVTLTTDTEKEIELGTLLLGISADAGFTNLTLSNQYKDFSVFEYDDFGNASYIDRARVSKYSGTADILIENYDMTDRLMTSLGANLVIMNGSGAKNEPPNSLTIFSATQKIGRFTSFSQKTNITDNDMDVMATYSFTLEEIV